QQTPILPKNAVPPERTLTLHADSVLMEDILSVGQLEISLTSPSPVAVFANPFRGGQTEALVITIAGEIKYLCRTQTGWELASIDGVYTAKEVVAATAPDGVVWAFYVNPDDSLARARLVSDKKGVRWIAEQTNLQGWKNLAVTYAQGLPAWVPTV